MTLPADTVRRFYDALDRGDVPAVLSLLDAHVEWTEAERFPYYSGTWHGPQAILPYSYGGTLGTLNSGSMDRRFFHRLGASQLDRTICSAAGEAGLKSVLGVKLGTEPEQFRHSKYILAWASNIHGNNVHLWPFIAEARRDGAKLVVIDPYRTRTAQCADWYLPINPGTDAALALGMMHVIIGENLHDPDYVAKHTLGFEQLREKVKEYSPERVAQWTGIAAEDVRKLAREYATVRPSVIRLNYGVQRSERGGMATRAVAMLPCITGSWKEIGGGLQMSLSEAVDLNTEALKRLDLMQTVPVSVVIMLTDGGPFRTIWTKIAQMTFPYYVLSAGMASMVMAARQHVAWDVPLLLLPVMYGIYCSYQMYFGREAAEQRSLSMAKAAGAGH